MILTSVTIACIAVMAGIKISERMGGGTIHFCLSHVLGARLGGAVTIVYCFAQVSASVCLSLIWSTDYYIILLYSSALIVLYMLLAL